MATIKLYIPLLLVVATYTSQAQNVFLDPSFGNGGKVITSFGIYADEINAIEILQDGKIIAAGYSSPSFLTQNFALSKYNSNGDLDSSFGNNGKVITPIDIGSTAKALTLLPSGKILVGGFSQWYINVAQYLSNGMLDSLFGTFGKSIIDVKGYYSEECSSIATQSNGKILLAGSAKHNGNDSSYCILARCHANGSLDSSFGNNGIVIGKSGKWNKIEVLGNNKIIAAGYTYNNVFIQKYHESGTTDTSFGNGGHTITSFADNAQATSMVVKSDGSILVSGVLSINGMLNNLLIQYNGNGIIDNSFGTNGYAFKSIYAYNKATSLALLNDDKIVVAGYTYSDYYSSRYSILRCNKNGQWDNTFSANNINGAIVDSFHSTYNQINTLKVQHDHKIISAGYSRDTSGNAEFALARYVTSSTMNHNTPESTNIFFYLYPNPCMDNLHIKTNDTETQYSIYIYSLDGRILQQGISNNGQWIGNMSTLPKGFYTVDISCDDFKIQRKVIIE